MPIVSMSVLKLIKQFQQWKETGQDLVLVTVVETEGHTYSKPGAQMLIAGDQYHGMVSGGCLEGDIAEHAKKVIATNTPKIIEYDLRVTPENELIGLGVGCEGRISLLLQKLSADAGFYPFDVIAERRLGYDTTLYALVIESSDPDTPIGTTLLLDSQRRHLCGDPKYFYLSGLIADLEEPAVRKKNDITLLRGKFSPLPRLLVLGAGIDAQPLVEAAVNIGWLVTVSDNRSTLLETMAEFGPEQLQLAQAVDIDQVLDLSAFDAVVIMSHHLDKDRAYLGAIAQTEIPYVGLLGPISRGRRLLDEVGPDVSRVEQRLRSPAGLDIGADSPESIALAIVSEIQAVLRKRHGAPLTP